MKSYKSYVFDFDYTLVDSSRGIVTCFRNVLDRHGYTAVTEMAIKRTIGKTLEQSFSILTDIADSETLAAYKREYVKEADMYMTVNTVLFPETVEVLRALRASGALLSIVSTKYRYRILDLLEQRGQTGLVDFIVGGEDVQAPKPDPEGLLATVAHFGCPKGETLYIGDSVVDAETAQAAGVDFAGVLHGTTTSQELAVYPHVCIMDDLCGLLPGKI